MMHYPPVTGTLLSLAVIVALVSAMAAAILSDALDRLHFSSLVVSFGAGLIALAVWIEDGDWQARIKVSLIATLLFAMNPILTHATARAARIRRTGHWGLEPEEKMLILGPEDSRENEANREKHE